MKYKISYEENPKNEDIDILENGITAFDKKMQRYSEIKSFAFLMRNEEQKVIAGCYGEIMYGHLFIAHLWVAEYLRGQGYGSALIQAAEKLANDKRCHFMAVNTMDWQALDFYKKLGFYVEFERHGFDKNSIFYYLRKDFKNTS